VEREKERQRTTAVQIGWVDGPRAIIHVGNLMMMVIVQLLRRQRDLLRRGVDAGHSPVPAQSESVSSCKPVMSGASSSEFGDGNRAAQVPAVVCCRAV
jgi:hypothetical protein